MPRATSYPAGVGHRGVKVFAALHDAGDLDLYCEWRREQWLQELARAICEARRSSPARHRNQRAPVRASLFTRGRA